VAGSLKNVLKAESIRLLLFSVNEHVYEHQRFGQAFIGGHLDLKDIKAIIDLMRKNSLSEFELERQDFKIKLKRGTAGPVVAEETSLAPQYATPPLVAAAGMPALVPTQIAAAPASGLLEIKSPMIGTFYRAPSPESADYVEVGTEVTPETVVCLIEAMKVMNEIKAEVKGVVTHILVENAKPVEFGQPLFRIRPT
jgi:acetyl-CoA carboxylase biotin carboxyl carrier protein